MEFQDKASIIEEHKDLNLKIKKIKEYIDIKNIDTNEIIYKQYKVMVFYSEYLEFRLSDNDNESKITPEKTKICQFHNVEWDWVKGHSGHPQNEKADELANYAMDYHSSLS